MPANKNETRFRNAVRKAGVPLAAKNDRYFPSLYIYQKENVYLDAQGKELGWYEVHYKEEADPVWFTFSNLDMFNSQKLHAAGFEFRFEELMIGKSKTRVSFYKAPAKGGKK